MNIIKIRPNTGSFLAVWEYMEEVFSAILKWDDNILLEYNTEKNEYEELHPNDYTNKDNQSLDYSYVVIGE